MFKRFRLYIFGRSIIQVMLCFSCILPSGTQFWFAPLLVLLIVNTWLEWCLPSFSLCNFWVFCGEVFLDYVNISFLVKFSPISFNIYWCFQAELINKMMAAKWLFSNYIISFIFISWHSIVKKNILLFLIYLYQYWFMDSYFIQCVYNLLL